MPFVQYRLFKNHPTIKKTFTSIAHIPDDQLQTNAVVRAHVLVFGVTVNTWIQRLDDPETLVALIHKNTDSHVVRGVKDATLFKVHTQHFPTHPYVIYCIFFIQCMNICTKTALIQ